MTTTKLPVTLDSRNAAVRFDEPYLIVEMLVGGTWYAVESWPTRGQAERAAEIIRRIDLESDILEAPSDCIVAEREDLELTII